MYFRLTLTAFMLVALTVNSLSQNVQRKISIIPRPEKVIFYKGNFKLTKNTLVINNAGTKQSAQICSYLVQRVKKLTGIELKISENKTSSRHNKIILSLDAKADSLGKEGYLLNVKNNVAVFTGHEPNGLFYAVQSFLQLIPYDDLGVKNGEDTQWLLPCLHIKDVPRFKWRGLHLDVSRHFFPKKFIKKYLDFMAMYKLNTFHFHLTDDQGWRIQIKKYPKLTQVGAWREGTGGDSSRYGGYYTQDDIKDIVAYAKSRYITVVPEIEMPGHSVAALAAYPQLSCTGGPFKVETRWGVFKDIYCAGNEETFRFLDSVLTEVMALFPSKYIHIGGDEVPKDRWRNCPKDQKRMKELGLKNEDQLQSYFIRRIEDFLNSKGRQIIGWDEILEGGLAPGATVMSWRGEAGGIAAAKQKHDVIMTPGNYLYFNSYQGDPKYEPNPEGRFLPLSKVYSYDPVPSGLTKDERKYIIGAEACMWTENLQTGKQVEYQLFPRIAALSEIVWTKKDRLDWNNFAARIPEHLKLYKFLGINYSNSVFDVTAKSSFLPDSTGLSIQLSTEINSPKIYYTTNGSNPTIKSLLYTEPIKLTKTTEIKAAAMVNGKLINRISDNTFYINKALGKKVTLKYPYDEKYSAGKFGLTNGIKGSTSYGDGKWRGFQVNDLDAVIDLDSLTFIKNISCGFLNDPGPFIFLPRYVEFSVSNDGKNFKVIKKVDVNENADDINVERKEVAVDVGMKARYIKVYAKNVGHCPSWSESSGEKAWLFVDEITVN